MWAALQRRFTDQNRPSCPPELLVRGLKVSPLDGQGSSATWSLGFKETGSVPRTQSLSRDFQSLAAAVDPDTTCYLVVYVGDLHRGSMLGAGKDDAAQWVLISYVPESSTAVMAKRMADNRPGLKAGLGSEFFCGDMWCSSRDQITLSHYIKQLEVRAPPTCEAVASVGTMMTPPPAPPLPLPRALVPATPHPFHRSPPPPTDATCSASAPLCRAPKPSRAARTQSARPSSRRHTAASRAGKRWIR